MTTKTQEKGIERGHIIPLKEAFSRTQSQALCGAALYKVLQRALGTEKNHFLENKKRSLQAKNSKEKREIYTTLLRYIEIDPEKLPPQFVKLFNLDTNAQEIGSQVKNIFATAHYLNKESARVLFIDGKIIVFKNQTKLVHTNQKRKLTQGEKKRYDIETTFNTFSTLYDAIRSQYYSINFLKGDQETMLMLLQTTLKLAHDIRAQGFGSKDNVFQRKIDEIIKELGDVKDYHKLGSLVHNLQEIAYTNKILEANRLEGVSHKFTQRFDDLENMITIISSRDIPKLEKILSRNENALEMFLAQITFLQDKEYVFSEYEKRLGIFTEKKQRATSISSEIPLIEPFGSFYTTIKDYRNHPEFLTTILPVLEESYKGYKAEHQEKLKKK